MGQHFEAARKRIGKIDWEFEDIYRPSHAKLVSEFFRRGKIFLDEMDSNKKPVVFRAAQVAGIDLPVNIKETSLELNQRKIGWLAEYFCTFYLEWQYLVDQRIPEALQYQDLYDPIIKLYERGGRIHFHHHELICGNYGFARTLSYVSTDQSPIVISNESLDQYDLDQYYQKIINIGSDHFDNKEKIASTVIERLRKYSKYSKDIAFQIELAELLLNKGISTSELHMIKNRLKYFTINNLGKQVSDMEKKDLAFRIASLKNRLNHIEVVLYETEGRKILSVGDKLITKS